MDKIVKILSGLLIFCILVIGLAWYVPQQEGTKKIVVPAPVPELTGHPAGQVNATQNGRWVEMNAGTPFSPRIWHCSVALPSGSIVLMGGEGSPVGINNETWISPDYGITWNRVTVRAPWTARYGQSCVALPDGSIVLMGGMGLHDVWRSPDNGSTWTEMTSSAPWSPREFAGSAVLPDGSVLLMGGVTGNNDNPMNDVWRSADKGANWTLMTGHAGWTPRADLSAVALPDGSVVVTGGRWKDDAWRSPDAGVTWQQMTAHAPWRPRLGQTAAALPDGTIVLMGGRSETGFENDTWFSHDSGTTWERLSSPNREVARWYATSVAMPDGGLVLMGGEGNTSFSRDIWAFLPQGEPVPTKQPTPVPTTIIPTPKMTEQKSLSSAIEVRDARDPSRFIRMLPINDFPTDSTLNITGPPSLNMTITTNYPEGSLFRFSVINEDSSSPMLPGTDIYPAIRGPDGLNVSSYTLGIRGWPIGHYRAEATRVVTNTTAIARFNVTPPGLWTWIWSDPVTGTVYEGDTITITGTTTMEPGSEIAVDTGMEMHPCPQLDPSRVNPSEHWLCDNTCNDSAGSVMVQVLRGTTGNNIWRASLNTTGWCWREEYYFRPRVDHWINVTGIASTIRVNRP